MGERYQELLRTGDIADRHKQPKKAFDEDTLGMASLYHTGASLEAVGRAYGRSAASVRARLMRIGVQIRKTNASKGRRFTEKEDKKLFNMRKSGKRWTQIAEELECTTKTARLRYKKLSKAGA